MHMSLPILIAAVVQHALASWTCRWAHDAADDDISRVNSNSNGSYSTSTPRWDAFSLYLAECWPGIRLLNNTTLLAMTPTLLLQNILSRWRAGQLVGMVYGCRIKECFPLQGAVQTRSLGVQRLTSSVHRRPCAANVRCQCQQCQ